MNRRKKIKQLLEAHAKKANAKLAPKSNKPKYISKADRVKLEAEAAQEPVTSIESVDRICSAQPVDEKSVIHPT